MNKIKITALLFMVMQFPSLLTAETIEGLATGSNNSQINWVEVAPDSSVINHRPCSTLNGSYELISNDEADMIFILSVGLYSTICPNLHETSAGVGLIGDDNAAYSDNPLRYGLVLKSSVQNAAEFDAPAGHISIALHKGASVMLGEDLFCFDQYDNKGNLIRAPRQQAADWSAVPKGLANVTPVLAFTAGTPQGPLSLSNDATFTIETRQQPASGQQAYLVYGDVVEGQLTVAGYKAMIQPRRADVNSYSCQLDSIYPCNLLVFAEAGTAGGEEEVDPEDVAEPDYSDIIALMKWDQIREGHDCFIGAATLPNLAWLAGFGLLFGLIRRR